MKVIFLDHDGVICLSTEWGGRFKKQTRVGRKLSQSVESLPVDARFDNFNEKAVKSGQVKFFDVAYIEIKPHIKKKKNYPLNLKILQFSTMKTIMRSKKN